MSACNRLDLQTLGSQQVMPKNLPDYWRAPDLFHMHFRKLKWQFSDKSIETRNRLPRAPGKDQNWPDMNIFHNEQQQITKIPELQ